MIVGEKTTAYVGIGDTLTIAASSGTGTTTRFTLGGAEPANPVPFVGVQQTFGPYDEVTMFAIVCDTGTLDYTVTPSAGPHTLKTVYEVGSRLSRSVRLPAGNVLVINGNNPTGYANVRDMPSPLVVISGNGQTLGPFTEDRYYDVVSTTDRPFTVATSIALNLIPKGGWALGSTRLALPGGTAAASGTNLYPKAQLAVGMPPWAGRVRFLLPALSATNGAIAPLTNDLKISWMTVFRGATAFPVTLNGQTLNTTVADGTLVWTDPVEGLTTIPNEMLGFRYELDTPLGTRYPTTYYPVLGGQDLGEARYASANTAPDATGLRTSGVIAPTTASNAQVWGPVAAAVDGYDGVTRVVLLIGDSRDVGQNDIVVRAATRGCMGEIARGLDDPTGGRVAFANFSVRGARADTWASNWGQLWAAIEALGNRSFHDVAMSINANDFNNNGVNPAPSLETVQARDHALWAATRTKAPGARIYHFFGHPWVTDTSGNLYSTIVDQTPLASSGAGGVQEQTNAWLDSGDGIPSDVVPVNLAAGFQAPGDPYRWDAPNIAGTLAAAVSSGRTISANFPSAPLIGMQIVLPGTGTAQSRTISDVQGAGPYTLTTADAVTTTNAINAPVRLAYLSDGVHNGQVLAKRAGVIVASKKSAGIIRTMAG